MNIFHSMYVFFNQYILIFFLLFTGIYLTIKYKFPQKRILEKKFSKEGFLDSGVSPIRLFFSSLGGSIGMGSLSYTTGSVLIGGPLVLIFAWMGIFFGLIIKYSEVYLSILHRMVFKNGKIEGGSFFLIRKAFKSKTGVILSNIFRIALLIYAIEIYQFSSLVQLFSSFINIHKVILSIILYIGIFFLGKSIKRISSLDIIIMPVFFILYFSSVFIIIKKNIQYQGLIVILNSIYDNVIFSRKSILLAMYHGIANAVYTCDLGIGYDSMAQSESSSKNPAVQGRLSSISMIIDCLVCTLTGICVLFSKNLIYTKSMNELDFILEMFGRFVPYGKIIFILMAFIAGFTTICGYFLAGKKLSVTISEKFGNDIFIIIAGFIFVSSVFFKLQILRSLMTFCGTVLIIINIFVLLALQKDVKF
jgi:AGCS family alanine or glycine:cation symporter